MLINYSRKEGRVVVGKVVVAHNKWGVELMAVDK